VLLGIWNKAGDHMRTYLEGFTLAAIADIARGDAPWP
jgi:DNA-binding IscR family transcriptional regulator